MADRILALAVDMLDALSEEWSNNTCNDWDPPDDMGDEDRARLARLAWENNGQQADEDPSEPVDCDFVAAGAVRRYLRHDVATALADRDRLRALLAAYGRAVEEEGERWSHGTEAAYLEAASAADTAMEAIRAEAAKWREWG